MGNKRKISIVEALNEIHLLDKRLQKLMQQFQGTAVVSQQENPKKQAQTIISGYQKIMDLMAYRNQLNCKVAASNHSLRLNIDGNVYTLSEVLQWRKNLEQEQAFYEQLIMQYQKQLYYQSQQRCDFENKWCEFLSQHTNLNLQQLENMHKAFKLEMQYELVDPLKIATALLEKIAQNASTLKLIQTRLMEYNAKTYIEID